VVGLETGSSLFLLAAPLVPGVVKTVDAVVTGVVAPCTGRVTLVPLVLGLLICPERGGLVLGTVMAPRRGRFCGMRYAAGVDGRPFADWAPRSRGLMRLDGARGIASGDSLVFDFLMADWRGSARLLEVGDWMLGFCVVGDEGAKLIA